MTPLDYRFGYRKQDGSFQVNLDESESLWRLLVIVYNPFEDKGEFDSYIADCKRYETFGLVLRVHVYSDYVSFYIGPKRLWIGQEFKLPIVSQRAQGRTYRRISFMSFVSYLAPAPSEKNPELWAYYENMEKACLKGSDGKGIRTTIKYGKLLKVLMPDLTELEVRQEVERWNESRLSDQDLTFRFATDAESFVRVYTGEQAPTLNPDLGYPFKSLHASCMRHSADDFSGVEGHHPVEVYASGDFAIVWAEKGGKIATRAVVPYNKAYDNDKALKPLTGYSAPIYTTSDNASKALLAYIEANGAEVNGECYRVTQSWYAAGYRLNKIELRGDLILMAYLDCAERCMDQGGYLTLNSSGDISCQETGGTTCLGPQYTCDSCSERIDEDSVYPTDTGSYCECCYNELFFYCERSNELYDVDDRVSLYSLGRYGRTYEESVSREWIKSSCEAVLCEDDNEYWLIDDCVIIEDSCYSPSYENYFQSAWDGELYHDVNAVTLSNGETVSFNEVKANSDWTQIDGTYYPVGETLTADAIAAE